MEEAKLPQATAWITVVNTSQGPSSQVNWEQMRGINHHPLFTADQMRAYGAECARLERERCAALCDKVSRDDCSLSCDRPDLAVVCAEAIRDPKS